MNNETPKPHLVVLTGAGISRESGIPTFRDSDGLWCGYRVEDVATADALQYNTKNVLDFLNDRRRELANVQPNPGHFWLAKLEEHFRVSVLTQNIDDLHERAGSSHIIHLHGELKKATSMINPDYIQDIGYGPIQIGDRCPHGGQLRPFVVLFGEPVPMMQDAACIAATASSKSWQTYAIRSAHDTISPSIVAGAGRDLEQDFRQLDTRQTCGHRLAQRDQ